MTKQHHLFANPAEPASTTTLQTLKIVRSTQASTPAQRRFNKLITRIKNLTEHLQVFEDRVQRLCQPHQQRMHVLKQAITQVEKTMVWQLHHHLQAKGLTPTQKKWTRKFIEDFLLMHPPQSEATPDPAWQDLFDLYHPADKLAQWEQEDRQEIEALREEVEAMIGRPVEGLEQARDMEEMIAILTAQLDDAAQQEQIQKAKKPRHAKRNAQKQRVAQQEIDAQTMLKQIYRQLASVLHPDRETDAAARAQKTALMSEANAAYERRDLSTLLRLQLQVAQVAPESLARMTDEKLSSMNQLLQEQVTTLEHELHQSEVRNAHSLGINVSVKSTETSWLQELELQHAEHKKRLEMLEDEVLRIRELDQFKLWVKALMNYEKDQIRAQKKWDKIFDNSVFGGYY